MSLAFIAMTTLAIFFFSSCQNQESYSATDHDSEDSHESIFFYNKANEHFLRGELDSAELIIDQGIKSEERKGNYGVFKRLVILQTRIAMQKEEVITHYPKLLAYKKHNDLSFLAAINTCLTNLDFMLGLHAKIIDREQETVRIYRDLNDTMGIMSSSLNVMSAYHYLGKSDLALQHYDSIAPILNEYGNPTHLSTLHGNIASFYIKLRMKDSALNHALLAYEFAKKVGNKFYETASRFKLCDLELTLSPELDDLSLIQDLDTVSQMISEFKLEQLKANTYFLYYKFYNKSKDSIKARLYLDSTVTLARADRNSRLLLGALHQLIELRKQNSNYKGALQAVNQARKLEDSLNTKNDLIQKWRNSINQNEQLNVELKVSKKYAKSERMRFLLMIAVFSLLLVITFVIIRDSIKRNELLNIIKQKNDDLEERRKDLKRLNEGLEETVQKRTENLRLKNKKIKEYLWINSHEVRGPLSRILAIIGLLDNYSGDYTKEEMAEWMQMIEKSSKELDSVLLRINDELTTLTGDDNI